MTVAQLRQYLSWLDDNDVLQLVRNPVTKAWELSVERLTPAR